MDTIDKFRRSENMRRIRSKDTAPEVVVRKLTHKLGYRFRLHPSDLPGRPDMIFPARRKAIFVHGCFWHQHEVCRAGRPPRSREEYWLPKLERNRKRDEQVLKAILALNWQPLVIWECEIEDQVTLAKRLRRFLGPN